MSAVEVELMTQDEIDSGYLLRGEDESALDFLARSIDFLGKFSKNQVNYLSGITVSDNSQLRQAMASAIRQAEYYQDMDKSVKEIAKSLSTEE